MTDSILESVKKSLGLDPDYTEFDVDILMHINSTFPTLTQIGVGPEDGFMIEDASATWDSFLQGNKLLNSVKSYIYIKVRLLFDPPAVPSVAAALLDQSKEYEWRLNVTVENIKAATEGA